MIVVSDTTPIISLLKAEQLGLLQKLFGTVCVPAAVYKELTENKLYREEAKIIQKCDFLQVEEVNNKESIVILRKLTGLDSGESEAIILADEKKSDVLLMDEHKGRQVAKKMGIAITGTIGILTQAFDEGMLTVEDIEKCIVCLKESKIRINEKLYQSLRKHVEEKI